ncbi:PAS-domain containing protein [Candidatus Sumerlaeota bacterium]|nr:PAS-domain containing protein [Candidatus Sumerlaeota bacterium]
MSAILILSVAIRLMALAWAIRLLLTIRDWRIGFLAGMIALMAVRQSLTLLKGPDVWPISFSANIDELPGLIVSVLAFLALLFLERMIHDEDRKSAQLAEANKELQEEALERGRADETLRKREALLETTFESMSQGMAVYDADLRLNGFNQEFIEILGYPADFIRIGMPFEEIARFRTKLGDYGPGDVEELVRERVAARRKGEVARREQHPARRQGHRRQERPHTRRRLCRDLHRHHGAEKRGSGDRRKIGADQYDVREHDPWLRHL